MQYYFPFQRSAITLLVALNFEATTSAAPLFSTLEVKNPHLRIGVSARRVNVDFSFKSDASAPLGITTPLPGGLGDVGLFTGAPGNITYDNGMVGPVDAAGTAFATITNVSQLTPTNPARTELGSTVQILTYQTNETSYTNTVNSSALVISDDQSSAGPSVQLAFPLGEENDLFLNAVIGYTFLETTHDHGLQPAGSQVVSTTSTTYNYEYDYLDVSLPVVGPGVLPGVIVYDVVTAAATVPDISGAELLNPRQTTTTSTGVISLLAVNQSHLDLKLHEIPFGFEFGRTLGQTKVAINGGGTLNIVDFSFSNQTNWYLTGNSAPVFSRSSHQSGTKLKVGAYVGINLTHPLNENGSVYFKAHSSYRWVDSLQATTIDAQADIDLSSWEGGFGIGFGF